MLGNAKEGRGGIHLVGPERGAPKIETEAMSHVRVANTFEDETGAATGVGAFSGRPFSRDPPPGIAQFNDKTCGEAGKSAAAVVRGALYPATLTAVSGGGASARAKAKRPAEPRSHPTG